MRHTAAGISACVCACPTPRWDDHNHVARTSSPLAAVYTSLCVEPWAVPRCCCAQVLKHPLLSPSRGALSRTIGVPSATLKWCPQCLVQLLQCGMKLCTATSQSGADNSQHVQWEHGENTEANTEGNRGKRGNKRENREGKAGENTEANTGGNRGKQGKQKGE
eukprot:353041-Chlamydomonas_euryale.AAC.3